MFKRIFIVGFGRLGSALAQQILNSGLSIAGVVSRKSIAHYPFSIFSDVESLKNELITGDVVFLTAPDSHIHSIAMDLDIPGITLIHCSGATEIYPSVHANSGVFYPLMTFNQISAEINWLEIPVFLESGDEDTQQCLTVFCNQLNIDKTHCIDSQQRRKIHVAAVIANNMIQALYAASVNFLQENGLPQDVLLPIVHQMVANWGKIDPIQSLTGPMVRGDLKTIAIHEELLSTNPELLAVYRDMNKLIARLLKNIGI